MKQCRAKLRVAVSRWFLRTSIVTILVFCLSGVLSLSFAELQDASGVQPPNSSSGFEVTGLGGGGGMTTPTISPEDPRLMFLTSDMSGVYRSVDGGKSWRLLHYRQLHSAHRCRPAFAGSDIFWASDTILKVSRDRGDTWMQVGLGPVPWRGTIIQIAAGQSGTHALLVGTAGGVWVSSDDGQTWKLLAEGQCRGLLVLGQNFYVTLNSADGAKHKAFMRSNNNGRTWQNHLTVAEENGNPFLALAGAQSGNDVCLYATVKNTGTVQSTDGGATWRVVQEWQQQSEIVMPQNQTRIAYTSGGKAVWRTTDGGRTWATVFHLTGEKKNVTPSWVQTVYKWGYYVMPLGLGVDPNNPEVVLVATQGDFYRTNNGGKSWDQVMCLPMSTKADAGRSSYRSIGLEVTSCWGYYIDPNDTNRHYIAYTDIGFARSVDGGVTWIPAMRGCPWGNTVYEIVFDPHVKGRIYAACSDYHDIPFWTNVGPTPKGRGGGVCVSDDFGETWRVLGTGLPNLPCTSIALDPRSPVGKPILYATMYESGVYKSTDGGLTWLLKANGLGNPGNLHLLRIRIHPVSGNLYCLITAFRQGESFSVPGGLWKSSDGGESWRDLTLDLKLAWPTDIALNPHDENTIYLAAGSAPQRPQGGIYKSTDGGRIWLRVLKDSAMGKWSKPDFDNNLTVALHPDDPTLVYAGSGTHGLWLGRDAGTSWGAFEEFPFRAPTAVTFEPGDHKTIRVSTFGSGVWRGPYLPVGNGGKASTDSTSRNAQGPLPLAKLVEKSGLPIQWKLQYEENFEQAFTEPAEWIEDTYGPKSPYHVDAFDEDGDFFIQKYGATFLEQLGEFRSFRKSFAYGKNGWLTVELYGRGDKKETKPESGGKFISLNGKARLISTQHTDAAIIRSTAALPRRYRVEVTVSNINFGGLRNGSWLYDNKINGYSKETKSNGPWLTGTSVTDNGVYFLCITDYPNPAPHNNVFLHHHRKVVMDTDNNNAGLVTPGAGPWSQVWNPKSAQAEQDGSHYIGMIWLQGLFGDDLTGNDFLTYTPDGWKTGGTLFVDKYLDGERYLFAIERDGENYTMSVTGKFYYGGTKTYQATRAFKDKPAIWHYNQTPDEYKVSLLSQIKSYNGYAVDTWPAGSYYPDYFFFGDPHINYYEGTADYEKLKLFVPVDK